VVIPAAYELEENTARLAERVDLPDNFDWDYPARRFLALAEEIGVPALDLSTEFRAEVQRAGLKHPWFSYLHEAGLLEQ